MWFRGFLPHLEAVPLIAVVEAYVESDRRAARDRLTATRTEPADHPRPGQPRCRSDPGPTTRRRPHPTAPRTPAAPINIGERPRIVVTIREQDLRERAEKAGTLTKGAEITAGDLRWLCCDADVTPVVLGGPSEILGVAD